MKKVLLVALSVISLSSFNKVSAQAFTTAADTVYGTYSGSQMDLHNNVTNITSNDVTIRWNVISTNFPSSWKGSGILGICDADQCRDDVNNTVSNGTSTFAPVYVPGSGDFHMQLVLPNTAPSGTYYLTASLKSVSPVQSKDITFIVTKAPTSVSNVVKDDAVSIYPNPATGNSLNISFNGVSGVRNIAVYNLIGKAISNYRVSGNSAQLDINDIPNGIYFVRLLDAQGRIVATRKFTRQ